jgi:hypothetical protein
MDEEKKPSEQVRLEVEVLVDAIDETEEKEDDRGADTLVTGPTPARSSSDRDAT